MQANFETANKLVLLTEGGYVNNKRDPGGPTNKGITLTTARKDISPTFTLAQLKALTDAQAGIVYKREYWDKVRGDDLPDGLDYATHDYGVNSGPARPARVLQRLVGVAEDGVIGSVTLAAIAKRDRDELVDALCGERLAFMKSLGTWETFGAGWTNRVNGVRTHAHAMSKAAKTAAPPPMDASAYAKQYLIQARDLPTGKAVPTSGNTTRGAAAAGAGGVVTSLTAIPHIGGYVGLLCAFGCVGLTALVIAELQAKMDRDSIAPMPGTPVIPAKA